MDLAEFLAEYLSRGIDNLHGHGHPMDYTKEGLEPIFKKALCDFNKTQKKPSALTQEEMFIVGFAYGSKYGYEGIEAVDGLPESEISTSYIIAQLLFQGLIKKGKLYDKYN